MQTLTDHEASMISLSHALESMAEEDANVVAARSRQVLSGPASQIDAAVDRLNAFLQHQSDLVANPPVQTGDKVSRRFHL